MIGKPVLPIQVVDLFPELLDALLRLLSDLGAAEWKHPTACAGWSVHDVALHLLGDDVGFVSRKRDGYALPASVEGWDSLVAWIDEHNALWVAAARRMSPRLLCDLLRLVGGQMCATVKTLDPDALGGPVSWAGPGPAPVWLDLAREYTERWLHQQHIRDAVDRPGLKGPRFLAPVLDTFVRALPRTYQDVDAPDGTLVALTLTGDAGGRWFLLREKGAWHLCLEIERRPQAEVVLGQELAWRLFTKGLHPEQVRAAVELRGDVALGLKALDTVSILA
jgi:uncharacterized protein (TIGR03083 family)